MDYPNAKTDDQLQNHVQLAYNYHGGQGSPFYSFASTGGLIHSRSHGNDMIRECNMAIDIAKEHHPEDTDQLVEFLAAIEFVTNKYDEDEDEDGLA